MDYNLSLNELFSNYTDSLELKKKICEIAESVANKKIDEFKREQGSKEIGELKEKIQGLENTIKEKKDEIERINGEMGNKDNEITSLKNIIEQNNSDSDSKINQLKEDLNKENDKFKNIEQEKKALEDKYKPLSDIANIMDKYNDLDDERVKNFLYELVKTDDSRALIYCGADENNIKQLSQFVIDKLRGECDLTTSEFLKQYFEYCIQVYNFKNPNRKYSKTSISVGDEYDSSIAVKTKESKASGNISEVILEGYIRKDDELFKAVVSIL
ncbi:MAG: hypothetical protein K6F77_07150 [Lachnospiraceae bacterium]|nr:hypothetical protein [Lachnospiraceae bacterium]